MSRSTNTAVWLIGIGILALTGWWWPGILFLAALSALVNGSFKGFLWLAGIGLLGVFDVWWPGILILLGLGLLVGGSRGFIAREGEIADDSGPAPSPIPEAEPDIREPAPAEKILYAPPARTTLDDLPDDCPACGGPVDATTVDWRGRRGYCGFCGMALESRSAFS